MTRLLLPSASRRRIGEHALRAYPEECCGILVGRAPGDGPARVEEVVATTNAAAGDRTRRYEIPIPALVAAHRRVRERGREIVGYYHSHPDRTARPSERDLERAWPQTSYLIAAVGDGRVTALRSWRLNAAGDDFIEESCEP